MTLPNPVKAHYPGEIWETHTGGLEVVLSSRLYNEGPFGTVITAAITAEPGLVLLVYTAEPGSPSAERLRLLASLAADHTPSGAVLD